jgi:hypothetical protein
VKGL